MEQGHRAKGLLPAGDRENVLTRISLRIQEKQEDYALQAAIVGKDQEIAGEGRVRYKRINIFKNRAAS
jgi:hypothetical protein